MCLLYNALFYHTLIQVHHKLYQFKLAKNNYRRFYDWSLPKWLGLCSIS